MSRTFSLVLLALLAGCSSYIERGPRLDLAGPELAGTEWESAARDAPDVRRAKERALAYFRAPIRRRLDTIPIYLSRCEDPELAGAYCQGGLSGLVGCGTGSEEIDFFYSPSREIDDWRAVIEDELASARGPDSTFTATLWFGGLVHRRVQFPLSARATALEAIRAGIREVLAAILVHEYVHALIADGALDAPKLARQIDRLDPAVYPIAGLVESGRDAYPWWLFLAAEEESVCLTAEYHIVFGYAVPQEIGDEFAEVVDGRMGDSMPVVVQIHARGKGGAPAQPER
ncbi:MAG: hypothetical protein HY720_28065 [Planctomycetes bacterium]|nr:hypothetical protein [Planctomycetota bacterium]